MTGTSPGSVDVVTSRAQLSAERTGQRLGVRSILVDPQHNAKSEHHDAALLLVAPTRAPAVSLAGSSDGHLLAPGAPLSVAGWGLLDNMGTPRISSMRRRSRRFAPAAVTPRTGPTSSPA